MWSPLEAMVRSPLSRLARSIPRLVELPPFGLLSLFRQQAAPYLVRPCSLFPARPGARCQVVTNLQLLSVPALPTGPGGVSTSLAVSGLTSNSGVYTLAALQSTFAPVQQTVNGNTYTGIPLVTLLNLNSLNINSQIVVGKATDGYEVVYSAAELADNANNILPYADTGGNFPADGLARTILPGDNKQGRWISNLSSLEVDPRIGRPVFRGRRWPAGFAACSRKARLLAMASRC